MGKKDAPRCGAATRKGTPCARRAGAGTDHVGQGRCSNHGGKTPIKHGRYSAVTRPRLAELIEQFRADPDPSDLTDELHLLRALCLDYIERYDNYSEALIRWHESFTDGAPFTPKPTQIADILSVGRFIGDIGKLVERQHKIRSEGSVTLATLNRVLEQFGLEVERAAHEVIRDEPARAALLECVESRWASIRLDQPTRGGAGVAERA